MEFTHRNMNLNDIYHKLSDLVGAGEYMVIGMEPVRILMDKKCFRKYLKIKGYKFDKTKKYTFEGLPIDVSL